MPVTGSTAGSGGSVSTSGPPRRWGTSSSSSAASPDRPVRGRAARAPREHGPGLVEDAIGRLGIGHVGAREHGLVLEGGRVDLAVAVALEDPQQGVCYGAHLARLFG